MYQIPWESCGAAYIRETGILHKTRRTQKKDVENALTEHEEWIKTVTVHHKQVRPHIPHNSGSTLLCIVKYNIVWHVWYSGRLGFYHNHHCLNSYTGFLLLIELILSCSLLLILLYLHNNHPTWLVSCIFQISLAQIINFITMYCA